MLQVWCAPHAGHPALEEPAALDEPVAAELLAGDALVLEAAIKDDVDADDDSAADDDGDAADDDCGVAEDGGAALVPDVPAVADEEAADEALVACTLELFTRDAEDAPAEDDCAAEEPPPDELPLLLLLDSPVPVVHARFTAATATPSHKPPRMRTSIQAPFGNERDSRSRTHTQ